MLHQWDVAESASNSCTKNGGIMKGKSLFLSAIILMLLMSPVLAQRPQIKTEYDGKIIGTLQYARMQYRIETKSGTYDVGGDDDVKVLHWLEGHNGQTVTVSGIIREMKDGRWYIFIKAPTDNAKVEVQGKAIVCGGKKVLSIADFPDTSLSISKLIMLPNGSANYLVFMVPGGTACPGTFKLISVSGADCRVSEEFGNCSDLYKATAKGDTIYISQPKMGSGKKDREDRWMLNGGKATKLN